MSSWKFSGRASPRYESKLEGDDESGIPMPEPSPSGERGFVSLPADAFESRVGYTWDLCMVIPKETPEGALSAVKIVKTLRRAGFETYLYYSVQRDEIICKIRAPLELLAKCASDLDYTMLLDEDDLKMMVEQGSKEASIAGRHINHDPKITPYSPYEYIYGKYCADARVAYIYARPPYLDHPFSSVHRIKLMIRIIESQRTYGCGMNISKLVATNAVKACFPFHDEQRRNALSERWIKKYARPGSQPLQDIKDYLGEKIALYFAFFGHYTSWLGPLSVLGLITFIDQVIEWDLDALLIPYFAVFVSFWAVLMLENWKRQESKLAMKWGMSNFEQIESDRPEFKGETIVSFIDGSPMTYFPFKDYVVLMTVANSVAMMMVLLAIALAALFLYLKVQWSESSNSFLSSYGSYLASFLMSVEIIVMNLLYKKVAVWTTERENHRTDTVFEDVLIVKLAVFNFVNSYVSLFYVAFVQPFVVGCSDDECLYSLCESLAIIFCVRLVSANTIELYLPRFMMLYKAKQERTGVRAGILLTEAEVQFAFSTYHEIMGPLGDMSEIAVQFGYVTMFVVVFPIAPLLAAISNYVQIRNDAQSMLFSMRRPFPRGAQDIGSWQGVFTAIATTAVATNAALVFFTASRYHWSGENLVWGFVIYQYVVFLIMAVFATLVPDVPEHVQFQLERQKFMIAKVIDQIADEAPPTVTIVEDDELEMEEGDDRAPPAPIELPKAWGCC